MDNLGFLTFAQNTKDIDYLRLAYLQAMNVKLLHPKAEYAVIVDKFTHKSLTDKMKKIFNYIIELPIDLAEKDEKKFANEINVAKYTPFKETIKLESDLLFTRSINHWFHSFRTKSILFSFNCKNYKNELTNNMYYRSFFVKNYLPNIYTGMYYFRVTLETIQFFNLAQRILMNWNQVKETFSDRIEEKPSTDVLFAITANIFGIENCTIPSLDYFNFIHLKPAINNWYITEDSWVDKIAHQFDNGMIKINNINQYFPVHYYDKNYCNDTIISWYEDQYEQQLG